MGLTKAQSVFDTTVANGDATAAYLFATNRLTSAAVNGNESLRTIAALQDGAGTAITSTAGAIDVNLKSGTLDMGVADSATFTIGTTVEQPVGGVYQSTTFTALATGKTGAFGMTAYRAQFTNLQDAAGSSLIGQKAMAGSLPVAFASDQSSLAVKLFDGAGTALTSTLNSGKQSLDVNVTGLSAATQHVDGTVADAVADADNPVKIGAKAYSTLAAATAGNRVNLASDLYRRLYVNASPNVAAKVATVTVGITAASIGTAQPGRRNVTLQNNGNVPIYIGFDATVTADTAATGGVQIPGHGGTLDMLAGDNIPIFAISGTAAQKLCVYELA